MVISRENVIMCCLVRDVNEYSEMVISRENVIMCCLVRAIDEYTAIMEWRLAGRM
jgi:hypothetical protein